MLSENSNICLGIRLKNEKHTEIIGLTVCSANNWDELSVIQGWPHHYKDYET